MGFDINKLIMESVSETLGLQDSIPEPKKSIQKESIQEQETQAPNLHIGRVASGLAAGSGALELVKVLRSRS